jgi:hypothetical protein
MSKNNQSCEPPLKPRLTFLLALLLAASACSSSEAPWPSQYHISPWETDRLTAADVVGPDGIAYPDFTKAGVTGGIPDIKKKDVRAEYAIFDVTNLAYGALADDNQPDDQAVAKACADALANAAKGGKSILHFPAGTFHLSSPLIINRSNVVIEGAGKERTVIKIQAGGKSGNALISFTPKGGKDKEPSGWARHHLTAPEGLHRGSDNAEFGQSAVSIGYSVGDWVRILPVKAEEGSTMRMRFSKPANHIEYADPSGHFGRIFIAKINKISNDGRKVFFDRTFPHDYYADEAPQMRKGAMLENCGVQDMTLETTSPEVAIDPLSLAQVAESWVKGVHFLKPANWPYTIDSVVRFEFRDCHFDGTWAPIGSGSRAYLPIGTMDVLMSGCRANDMRHMPVFQHSMRCVVRACRFDGRTVQSPQLHGRFPTENLVEQCTFDFREGKGQTAWATDISNSLRHGPNGPRNVYYHNIVKSGAGYIRLGGAQENPIIAYNQILRTEDSQVMPGIWASDRTFDAVIIGNIFQVTDSNPLIVLEDTSCVGWTVKDNVVYGGNRSLWSGDGNVSLSTWNRFKRADTTPAAPTPEAESIFEWQRSNAQKPRLLIQFDNKNLRRTGETTRARLTRIKSDRDKPIEVGLSTDNPALDVPAKLILPANATSVEFEAKVLLSRGAMTVKVSASHPGMLGDSDQVTINDSDPMHTELMNEKFAGPSEGLPEGWRSTDIGRTTAGSAEFSKDVWTLQGDGLEAYVYDGTLARSGRRSAHKTLRGDGEISARIVSVTNAKQAGLMIADDEAPITEFIMVTTDGRVLSTGHNTENNRRPEEYAKAGDNLLPVWLRLKRMGSTFIAYRSNAKNPHTESDWIELARVDFYRNNTTKDGGDYKSSSTLDDTMHFGIFVNSGERSKLAAARFDNVRADFAKMNDAKK